MKSREVLVEMVNIKNSTLKTLKKQNCTATQREKEETYT